MVLMFKNERTLLDRAKVGKRGLMISFVRALYTHREKEVALKGGDGQISKTDLQQTTSLGLLMMSFVGHDTLANTLPFSMLLVAENHKAREWLIKENENLP